MWLGKHIKSGKQFAIKQIITENTHQTHLKEIWFGTNFFMLGGKPKPEFKEYSGVKNLAKMYSYEINHKDTWIFYEQCGSSLGNNLYDIKAEKLFGDQKLYKVTSHLTLDILSIFLPGNGQKSTNPEELNHRNLQTFSLVKSMRNCPF